MGTPTASIGNICMSDDGQIINRSVDVQLDFCVITRTPTFQGLDSEGFELWVMDVALDGSSSPLTTIDLPQVEGPMNIVGIDFTILLAGVTLRRRRRGYMAAQPCG